MIQNLFVAIYDFFTKRKLLLWLAFFVTLGGAVTLALKVKYLEDVTSILPNSKAIRAMNDVISHTQAGEQIVFIASFKDTAHTDPDSLINAVNGFGEQVQTKCAPYIDTMHLQMGGGYEEALLDIFQNNLPLFLTENDYKQLDTLLQPVKIDSTMQASRKILLSPASVVYKQMVAQDPAAISRIIWGKLRYLQFDPNYEIYNGYIFSKDQRSSPFS